MNFQKVKMFKVIRMKVKKKFKTVKIKKRKSSELKGRGQTGALRNDEKKDDSINVFLIIIKVV